MTQMKTSRRDIKRREVRKVWRGDYILKLEEMNYLVPFGE
jgi:hypothetical protein